jgi:catechol 2,3-dioxygenase-like lactoylglutathione lyase family enzyme
MFDHVTIRVSARPRSERFYETALRTLGIDKTGPGPRFVEWDDFSIAQADEEKPVTHGLHVGFVAPSRAHVDAFWRVGTDAGYRSDGAPGPRPQYSEDYYGSFVLDPDGNSVEAVTFDEPRRPGQIDHLWLRTNDVAAAKLFYETIAPHAGLRVKQRGPDRVQITAAKGSFSYVTGTSTEHVHLAFPASDDAAVDAFHRAATDAGYRDNGAPGERPVYHEGYYGAYVLDPDGHNVELVNHNR